MDNFFNLDIDTNDLREDYEWLSIVDYSRLFDVSVSTIRRKIKARKLEFTVRDEMYFIKVLRSHIASENSEENELCLLKRENQKLKEEIQELKMLIEAYEKFN